MKNANKRGLNNLNNRGIERNEIYAIVQLIIGIIFMAIALLAFGCSARVYRPSEKAVQLKPMQPYLLPGGHRLTAHESTIFIIDSAGNRLFNVYVSSGKIFITDSTTFKK